MVEAREHILRGEIGWLIFMMNKERHPSWKTKFSNVLLLFIASQWCYITILMAIMAFMIMKNLTLKMQMNWSESFFSHTGGAGKRYQTSCCIVWICPIDMFHIWICLMILLQMDLSNYYTFISFHVDFSN